MSSDSRRSIMARVRHGSRNSGGEAQRIAGELESFGEAPCALLPHPDTATAFLINVIKNQGSADTAANRSEAVKLIAGIVYQRFRSHKLAVGQDSRLAALPWRDGGLLPRFEPAEDGEMAALSYARLGIAETGASVTLTGRANPSNNNLLPESHIVLVDSADLVVTMEQAWDRIDAITAREGRPRGINFIAGPSSTGDIEFQLVKGAHGPRNWHVILLGEQLEEALARARELCDLSAI